MYGDPTDGYGQSGDYDVLCIPSEIGIPQSKTKDNKPMSMKPVKVKVQESFRVLHPDTHEAHTGGDEITVPEHLANEWTRSGWVEPVTTKPATTKEKS